MLWEIKPWGERISETGGDRCWERWCILFRTPVRRLSLIHRDEFSIMERGGGLWGYMGGMGVSRKGSDPPITSATNKGAGRPDGNWWWLSCWLGGRNSYRRRGASSSCTELPCMAALQCVLSNAVDCDARRGPQIPLCHEATTCIARPCCWIGNIPPRENRQFMQRLRVFHCYTCENEQYITAMAIVLEITNLFKIEGGQYEDTKAGKITWCRPCIGAVGSQKGWFVALYTGSRLTWEASGLVKLTSSSSIIAAMPAFRVHMVPQSLPKHWLRFSLWTADGRIDLKISCETSWMFQVSFSSHQLHLTSET